MMKYQLPKLNYDYNALEPYIDAKTMEEHYNKHHGTYVKKLNEAIEKAGYNAPADVNELIANLKKVPQSIRKEVRNNGGGHANHSFFWKMLAKNGGKLPKGELAMAINEKFGSFEKFKEKFAKAAKERFGSGWVWLCVKPKTKALYICSTPNQDNPLMQGVVRTSGIPILGLDVWEHAYYLHYQSRRPDYVQAFWNVVDWGKVATNYKKCG